MTVSHHMLRRRARAKASALNASRYGNPGVIFVVEKALRGPWRWRVVMKPSA